VQLRRDHIASPIGDVLLVHDDDEQLRALDFGDYEPRMLRLLKLHYGAVTLSSGPMPRRTREALNAYFAGDCDAPSAIPVATGGTQFQRQVWAALRRIPTGRTKTYGAIAAELGTPSAMRAVGLANGANPIAIVVPCHRVIGVSGSLTGFGGGLHRKRWLLEHEGVRLRPERTT